MVVGYNNKINFEFKRQSILQIRFVVGENIKPFLAKKSCKLVDSRFVSFLLHTLILTDMCKRYRAAA